MFSKIPNSLYAAALSVGIMALILIIKNSAPCTDDYISKAEIKGSIVRGGCRYLLNVQVPPQPEAPLYALGLPPPPR